MIYKNIICLFKRYDNKIYNYFRLKIIYLFWNMMDIFLIKIYYTRNNTNNLGHKF